MQKEKEKRGHLLHFSYEHWKSWLHPKFFKATLVWTHALATLRRDQIFLKHKHKCQNFEEFFGVVIKLENIVVLNFYFSIKINFLLMYIYLIDLSNARYLTWIIVSITKINNL